MFKFNTMQIKASKTFFLLFLTTLLLFIPLAFIDAQILGQLIPCDPKGAKPANVSGCELKHILELLVRIYNFLLGLTAFIAMLFLVWGGIQMFSPSPNGVEGGKKTVMYAITGLVIILTSYVIMNTVIYLLSGGSTDIGTIINNAF